MQALTKSNIHENTLKIVLDGSDVLLNGNFQNLEEILIEIMSAHIPEDRTIWNVILNGSAYNETIKGDAKYFHIEHIHNLTITTKTSDEILLFYIANGENVSSILLESGIKIAEMFRKADVKSANSHYMNFIEAFQDFYRMIQSIKQNLDMDVNHISIKGFSVSIGLMHMENLLDEMLTAQEKMDWIMIADLLESELVPLLDVYKHVFPLIKTILHLKP